jgi:hypothetical protein
LEVVAGVNVANSDVAQEAVGLDAGDEFEKLL